MDSFTRIGITGAGDVFLAVASSQKGQQLSILGPHGQPQTRNRLREILVEMRNRRPNDDQLVNATAGTDRVLLGTRSAGHN